MDFEDIPAATEEEFQLPPPPAAPVSEFQYDQIYDVNENVLPDPEPAQEDALTKFTREWGKKLDDKRAAEFEHEKACRAKAGEDLSNWKTQREIRLNAKKEKNRTEEEVFVESLGSEVDLLKTWDRVSKLIDVNEDQKGSDVTRMRKLFIHLKNEPLESTRSAALTA